MFLLRQLRHLHNITRAQCMTACIRFTVLILRIRGSNIVVRFEKRPAWLAGAGSVRTPGERKKSAGALAKKRYG